MLNKDWHKQRYERLKAEGLCTECGKVPARPDRVTCGECAKRLSESQKRKRQKYIADGRCTICGKPAYRTNRLCLDCAIKTGEYRREKYRRESIEKP